MFIDSINFYAEFFPYLLIIVSVIAPITLQIRSRIDDTKFKIYKIKKFSFLFRGRNFASTRTHGIILPVLFYQIQGYVVGISLLTITILNKIYNFTDNFYWIILIITFIHLLIVVTIDLITDYVSTRRGRSKHAIELKKTIDVFLDKTSESLFKNPLFNELKKITRDKKLTLNTYFYTSTGSKQKNIFIAFDVLNQHGEIYFVPNTSRFYNYFFSLGGRQVVLSYKNRVSTIKEYDISDELLYNIKKCIEFLKEQ